MMKKRSESVVSWYICIYIPIYFFNVLFTPNCYVGYYLATLEAATQHIVSLAEQFEDFDKASSLFSNELLPASDLY